MGGGQSLTPQQQQTQSAIDQQQLQYYQWANALQQQQFTNAQPTIGIAAQQMGSMGGSGGSDPRQTDPWSYAYYWGGEV